MLHYLPRNTYCQRVSKPVADSFRRHCPEVGNLALLTIAHLARVVEEVLTEAEFLLLVGKIRRPELLPVQSRGP